METEVKTTKLYYNIGEVAEMFDVNASLIRFWEKEFDIIKPKKNAKGNRKFTQKDIEHFRLIYHLVKEQGLTLKGAQKRIKENFEGEDKSVEVIEKLKQIKEMLLDIKKEL